MVRRRIKVAYPESNSSLISSSVFNWKKQTLQPLRHFPRCAVLCHIVQPPVAHSILSWQFSEAALFFLPRAEQATYSARILSMEHPEPFVALLLSTAVCCYCTLWYLLKWSKGIAFASPAMAVLVTLQPELENFVRNTGNVKHNRWLRDYSG